MLCVCWIWKKNLQIIIQCRGCVAKSVNTCMICVCVCVCYPGQQSVDQITFITVYEMHMLYDNSA